jgi:hypothetical protein
VPAARTTVAAACLLALLTAGCDSAADPPTSGAAATSAAAPASASPTSGPTSGPTSAPPSPVAAFDKEVVVTVAKRKVTPPTGRVEVGKGSLVRITVTSDVADELHVHGYDKTLALPAGSPASIDLRVDRTGLFEVEAHSSHLVLFQLVVR